MYGISITCRKFIQDLMVLQLNQKFLATFDYARNYPIRLKFNMFCWGSNYQKVSIKDFLDIFFDINYNMRDK